MEPEENHRHIPLSEEEFKEFYDNFGSNHFQLQSRVLEDLGTKQIDIYFKSIGLATTVIGVIGLIAGFGFTALGYVQSLWFFFVGEGLLLGAIFYGLFWTQKIYQGEFKSLESERRKYLTFYAERNEKFMELYNSWISTRGINRTTLTELNKIDMESINLFKSEKGGPIPSIYSQTMYVLMIAGTLVLFSSFFICDLLRLVSP